MKFLTNLSEYLYFEHLKNDIDLPLIVRKIPRDGKCLFSCFSFDQHNNLLFNDKIRNILMNHMESNQNDYIAFVKDNAIDLYISNMRINTSWGTELEIKAYSELYYKNIHVHVLNNEDVIYHSENNNTNWLHLYYDNHVHYHLLLPITTIENIRNESSNISDISSSFEDLNCNFLIQSKNENDINAK